MIPTDRGALLGFAALAAWIWARDTSWLAAASDTLPILVGLPLFVALGRPWRFRATSTAPPTALLLLAAALLLAGAALDSTVALSAGATALLASWLSARLEPDSARRARRLLPLVFLSLPWLALDGQSVGWWFRLSGAWATAGLYRLVGLEVSRDGVQLLVQGLSVSVDAACAGMNALQAALQTGMTVAALHGYLARRGALASVPAVLVGVAWLANTLRIVALCAIALTFGVQAAQGLFHTLGGLVVLLGTFGLTWRLFPPQKEAA